MILRWVEQSGLAVDAALERLNVYAADGVLDAHLAWAYVNCHDKKRDGQRIARRTYYNWVGLGKNGGMAPGRKTQDLSMPAWGQALLAHYRLPQKPPLTEAYAATLADWSGEPFSYAQAQRLLKKIEKYAPEVLYRGRNQGSGLKAMLPYVKRGTADMFSNDVWTGDGHGMKARLAHPDHGRPFTPEVTVIMDVASRCIMGWSVAFSENVVAVADALRHAVSRHGLPLIYYSDNGGGQTGKVLDAPVGGMLARLGIDHQTGIPGNPQGRGMIERLWGTLIMPIARQLPTFGGAGHDKDYLRKVGQQIDKDLRKTGKSENLPSLNEFMPALEEAVRWYNFEHQHRALDGMTPAEAYATRLREEDRVMLAPGELDHLFRPHVERVATRGTVVLWNNTYANQDLMAVDGQKVLVGYDLHDAGNVIITRPDGEFICKANFNGNEKRYFATSKTDELRHQRVHRNIKKKEAEIDLARAELPGATVIEHDDLDEMREILARMPIKQPEVLRSAAEVLAEMEAMNPQPAPAPKPREMNYEETVMWARMGGPDLREAPAEEEEATLEEVAAR